MSYEVYVDVRHHPRHLDEWPIRESTAAKMHWEEGQDPMPLVASVVRGFADEIHPETALEADGRRVWVALHNEIQRVGKDWDAAPNTTRVLLESLFRVADALGLGDGFLPGWRRTLTSPTRSG